MLKMDTCAPLCVSGEPQQLLQKGIDVQVIKVVMFSTVLVQKIAQASQHLCPAKRNPHVLSILLADLFSYSFILSLT